ncbi:hypothetical protein [Rheinheimera texasensis]|uniref:hypothetical protein n=1 Tax=Rheinheimera texasensis TaxID=306205 RepID=UPI0004E12E77|nr:hypothetical protein [Rheinheimera texasensis]
MQKPVVFIAGVVVGAAAVLTLSAWWAPAPVVMTETASPAANQPAIQPDVAGGKATPATTLSAVPEPTVATTVNHEVIEFTPAQLDELAEQRRERQERVDRSNMHLRYPAAYAGKYAAFQGNEFYASAVESFESGEMTSDWAEKAQQVIQQFFDQRPQEFAAVRVECRATMCRIEGQAMSLEAYDRYFDNPRHNIWPTLGMSAWGGGQHMVPNDSSNAFVFFKYKNDDDFKQK